MSAPVLVPYTNNYVVGRGRVLFFPRVAGVLEGGYPLGNCPEFSINITAERLIHKSSESGLSETDFDKLIGIEREAKITCENISTAVLRAFLAGTSVTVTQAAATVSNEAVGAVKKGLTYRLGLGTLTPDGANTISAVSVLVSASNFVISTPYTAGQVLLNPTPDAFLYLVTVGGTSAGTLPTFPSSGATATSGGVTIKNIGSTTFANVTDFTYDPSLAFLNVLETGAIAALITQIEALGGALSLKCTYTKAATTVAQIQTGASGGLEGELHFLAENPFEPDVITPWIMPSVNLAPDGDLGLITENELQTVSFVVGINKRDSSTPAIKRNGAPALA